jgi:hypothetical protein
MELSSDTKWCAPLDHVVKQPTTKMKQFLESQEIKFDRVWHDRNLFQGSRLTPPNEYQFLNEK